MQLSPSRFNAFLHRIGQNLTWAQSSRCPCAEPYSGSPDPACDHCQGIGYRWSGPVATFAGVVSRDLSKQYGQMAEIEAGDVMLVIPGNEPIYAIQEYDRVVMSDRTERWALVKTRGRAERLRFDPLTVDRAEWLDGDTIISGLPDSFGRDGVTWATGGPPQGVSYSIGGTRHPEFYCYLNLPLDRPHHGGAALPRRVVLRRMDLLSP